MKATKIVLIGAGSMDFGAWTVADVLGHPDLHGGTLSLVDIDADALRLVRKVAARMNAEWGSGMTIEATVDRTRALPNADFVIVAIEVERMARWQLDFEIPLKHGLRQPFAENGGPAGFAHAARNIAPVLAICADMRKLCPDAWLFNYTNPVPRVALAARKYGGIKGAGFCHGIGLGCEHMSRVLGIPEEQLDIKAAGLNHFSWVVDLRRKPGGEDLYPALRRAIATWPKDFHPLTRDVFAEFGLWPMCGDSHIAEYLPWVTDARTKPWEKYHLNPPRFAPERRAQRLERERQHLRDVADGTASLDEFREGSGERAVAVAAAIATNKNSYELALNIPNEHYVPNLPEGAVVEVPAMVSALGIRGVPVGNLPEPIAELCRRQIAVAELAVQAAATGDLRAARHALLLDPMITDMGQAAGILADYLEVHGDLLPQFAKPTASRRTRRR
jgi:alpha-galactosidase/6-phospho-beta-glucosidase family protein